MEQYAFATAEYPCPCCGYIVFLHPPGHHGVCPICRWEDDLSQLRFPLMVGAANHVSLKTAQENFSEFGACEQRHLDQARAPDDIDRQEPTWRPLDERRDNIEEPQRGIKYGDSYPLDTTVLYYWRETYWRRMSS